MSSKESWVLTVLILLTDWGNTALKLALVQAQPEKQDPFAWLWQCSVLHVPLETEHLKSTKSKALVLPTAKRAGKALYQAFKALHQEGTLSVTTTLPAFQWLHAHGAAMANTDEPHQDTPEGSGIVALTELQMAVESALPETWLASWPTKALTPVCIGLKQVANIINLEAYATNEVGLSQLGLDRALTLLATKQAYPNTTCLLVDAGTASTIDALTHTGAFAGGVILPGVHLLEDALYQRLRVLKPKPSSYPGEEKSLFSEPPDGLGLSTQACIKQGQTLGYTSLLAGLLWQQASTLAQQGFPVQHVLLTGGDAPWLYKQLMSSSLFKQPCFSNTLPKPQLFPNAVLHGLLAFIVK